MFLIPANKRICQIFLLVAHSSAIATLPLKPSVQPVSILFGFNFEVYCPQWVKTNTKTAETGFEPDAEKPSYIIIIIIIIINYYYYYYWIKNLNVIQQMPKILFSLPSWERCFWFEEHHSRRKSCIWERQCRGYGWLGVRGIPQYLLTSVLLKLLIGLCTETKDYPNLWN